MKLDLAIRMLKEKPGIRVYLGTPFSDPDFRIRTSRFNDVTIVAGRMCHEGILVYSPITHYWPQVSLVGYPKKMLEPGFWRPFNDAFLAWADILAVLMNDGWRRSVGLSYEMEEAERTGKDILMIDFY